MVFTVAIAGITGRFGRTLVAELLNKHDVVVKGLVRDPSKLPESIRSARLTGRSVRRLGQDWVAFFRQRRGRSRLHIRMR